MNYLHPKPLALLLSITAGVFSATIQASGELAHRYSFSETSGTAVSDSVGGANGILKQVAPGGTPAGSLPALGGGQVFLDGVGGYVDLPNGLVSTKTNITIEAWVTWGGGSSFQRIFDFGSITNNTGGLGGLEDTDGTLRGGEYYGTRYLFMSPNGNDGRLRVAASGDYTSFPWDGERGVVADPLPFPSDGVTEAHVAVAYGSNVVRLFYNGEQVDSVYVPTDFIELSDIEDVNSWLGRSTYGGDPLFSGYFNEFRVHDTLLTAQELRASAFGGPDNLGYEPGEPVSLELTAFNSMLVGETQTAQAPATFSGIGTIILSPQDLDSLTSSAPNVVQVDAGGRLVAVGPGNATITARVGTISATAAINVAQGAPELRHRYSFNETSGTTVADSVGGQNGTVVPPLEGGTPLTFTNGQINFPGGAYTTAGYVDLPNGLISSKTNIAIEFWFTWDGPNADSQIWQRVFDFGNSAKGEDPRVNAGGLGYIMFTPRIGGGGTQPARVEFRSEAPHVSALLQRPGPFPIGQEVHVVVIYAPRSEFTRFYMNGLPVASGTSTPFELSSINDINNWLGVSQWPDSPLDGRINELRIYEGTLSEVDVAVSRHFGPDTLPTAPGSFLSVSMTPTALLLGDPASRQAVLRGNFQNVANVDITGLTGVTFQSEDTNVFTVSASGALNARTNAGAVGLVGSYQGQEVTSVISVLAPTTIRVSVPTAIYAGGAPVALPLLADFPGGITNGFTNVNVSGFATVSRSSSNPSVATINAAGMLLPIKPGTTTITSTYAGQTDQVAVTVQLPPGYQQAELVHRYSFNEAPDTATVEDLVGNADGTVVNLFNGTPGNNNFNGTGQLVLVGSGNSQAPASAYVDLPNGLLSNYNSVTLEGWVTWHGPADSSWQRIFDIGMSSGATNELGEYFEDVVANPGRSYMFLTPRSGNDTVRFAIKQGTDPETPILDAGAAFAVSNETHFALVYDLPAGGVRLYRNGQRVGTAAATLPLDVVDDRNVWLGRAQWVDPMFNGSYNEFRIYNGVLFDEEIAASYHAGPNALPVVRPSLTIRQIDSDVIIEWEVSAGAGFTLERTAALGGDANWSSAGIPTPTVEGDVYRVRVPAQNAFFYRLRN